MGCFRTRLRILLATLAVAITAAFTGASALSVVDRVQHSHHAAHHHDIRLAAAEQVADPALADHLGSGLDPLDRDHQPGAGHQHVDAPPAGLTAPIEPTLTGCVATLRCTQPIDAAFPGRRPDGLERPPRLLATFA